MKLQSSIPKAFLFSMLFLAACNNMNGPSAEMKEKDLSPPPPPVAETEDVVSKESNAGGSAMSFTATETNANANSDKSAPIVEQSAGVDVKIPEKIKKTAYLNITVDDYKVARASIEKIVRSGHAYIGAENEQNNTYSLSNTIIIRVPNKDFDGTVNNIASIAGHVNTKSISMEDVTAQFVDITARLKSKKEVEARYIDILKKAAKVSDILEVEAQLRVIREEIEAKEGALKYLNDQVDYSTINLTIHQEFEFTPQDRPGFFGRMGSAFGNGWNGFLSFLVGLMYAWPLWIFMSIGGYVLYRFIKKQRKK